MSSGSLTLANGYPWVKLFATLMIRSGIFCIVVKEVKERKENHIMNLPETTPTLVAKINAHDISEDEWNTKYVPRYYGPVEAYASYMITRFENAGRIVDGGDVATFVFAKLWSVLQKGDFMRMRCKSLRKYISQMIYHRLMDLEGKAVVRHESLGDMSADDEAGEDRRENIFDIGGKGGAGSSIDDDIEAIDLGFDWCKAFWDWANKFVYRRSNLSEEHRKVLQMLVLEGASVEDVAEEFSTTSNNVSQIKSRFLKAVKMHLDELLADRFLFDESTAKMLNKRYLEVSGK